MTTPNLGRRGSNQGYTTLQRIENLERATARIPSRYLNGPVGYDAQIIAQSAHGFAVGDWVGLVGPASTWAKAVAASTSPTYKAIGVVRLVVDTDTFEVVLHGRVQIRDYTLADDWTNHYLSTSAGTITSTAPAKPTSRIPLAVALTDHWLYVSGYPCGTDQERLSALLDVTITTPTNGQLLKYDTASGTWINGATALTLLSDVVITSVADLQVLSYSAGTGKWINRTLSAGVTTLAALTDVTLTTPANLDYLRYDSGTSKWINASLGEMQWSLAVRTLSLDGGASASAASKIGIGKAGSRIIVANGSGFEFLLSGDPDVGSEKSARIRSTAATDVSFYDQATSTFSGGTKVIEWGTNTAYSTRYWRFHMPLQVRDDSGTGSTDLIVRSTAAQLWDIADDVSGTTKYLTFVGPSGDAPSIRRILLAQPLDLAGKTIYADKAGGSSNTLVFSSSGLSITSSGAATITVAGASTLDVGSGSFTFSHSGGTADLVIGSTTKVGASSGSLGFYQGAGTTKQTVTGAKAGNVALANLMTALATLGLVTDGTT